MRGMRGAASWGVCALAALSAVGCSSSDSKSSAGCGTDTAPTQLEIGNVSPAAGSSVANTGTVMSFTIMGELVDLSPSLSAAATHTAGAGTPNPLLWTFSISSSGKDSVFTSSPITWAMAPGHVELDAATLFKDPSSGCVSEIPSPLFSYDITATP
jgi:hypothetical protein